MWEKTLIYKGIQDLKIVIKKHIKEYVKYIKINTHQ